MSDLPLNVRPCLGKRDFETFVDLPWEVYRDDPLWVPPLRKLARAELRREDNPFLRHCDFQFFLLESEDRAVGRIAAFVDRIAIEAWGRQIGLFAYFECALGEEEGALDGSKLLLAAARDWLRDRGMELMRGPWSFQSQEWGMVVEGFEPEAVVMAPYNPPRYPALMESFGLKKAKDLLCWEMSMPEGYTLPERIFRLTDLVAHRYGIRIRTMDPGRFDDEARLFARLAMETLKDNWGITPMTEAEVEELAKDLKPVIRPECVLFAQNAEGRDIAFAMTIPDLNVLLKETRGRLLPFGWARIVWGLPRVRRYRVVALGIVKEYQGRGIDALLYKSMWEHLAEPSVTMEINYVLEDNLPMVNAITKLGAKPSRRYRVYEMPTEENFG